MLYIFSFQLYILYLSMNDIFQGLRVVGSAGARAIFANLVHCGHIKAGKFFAYKISLHFITQISSVATIHFFFSHICTTRSVAMSTITNRTAVSETVRSGQGELFRIQKKPIFRLISKFFADDKNFEKLYEILKVKSKGISLRAIEYSVVNRDQFEIDLPNHGRYRDILDAAGKKSFDVFRRHSKFTLTRGDKSVVTNLAQLRFLKFSIEAGLVDWIFESKNLKLVEKAMTKRKKEPAGSTNAKKIRKKQNLRAIGMSNTGIIR